MNEKTKYGIVVLLDALGAKTASLTESLHYLKTVQTLKSRVKASLKTTLTELHSRDPDIETALKTLRLSFFGDSVLLTYEIKDQILFVHYLSRILFILTLCPWPCCD